MEYEVEQITHEHILPANNLSSYIGQISQLFLSQFSSYILQFTLEHICKLVMKQESQKIKSIWVGYVPKTNLQAIGVLLIRFKAVDFPLSSTNNLQLINANCRNLLEFVTINRVSNKVPRLSNSKHFLTVHFIGQQDLQIDDLVMLRLQYSKPIQQVNVLAAIQIYSLRERSIVKWQQESTQAPYKYKPHELSVAEEDNLYRQDYNSKFLILTVNAPESIRIGSPRQNLRQQQMNEYQAPQQDQGIAVKLVKSVSTLFYEIRDKYRRPVQSERHHEFNNLPQHLQQPAPKQYTLSNLALLKHRSPTQQLEYIPLNTVEKISQKKEVVQISQFNVETDQVNDKTTNSQNVNCVQEQLLLTQPKQTQEQLVDTQQNKRQYHSVPPRLQQNSLLVIDQSTFKLFEENSFNHQMHQVKEVALPITKPLNKPDISEEKKDQQEHVDIDVQLGDLNAVDFFPDKQKQQDPNDHHDLGDFLQSFEDEYLKLLEISNLILDDTTSDTQFYVMQPSFTLNQSFITEESFSPTSEKVLTNPQLGGIPTLRNIGNVNFMNSVIIALHCLTDFSSQIATLADNKRTEYVAEELANLFHELNNSDSVIPTSQFYHKFRAQCGKPRGSYGFLQALLQQVSKELAIIPKQEQSFVFDNIRSQKNLNQLIQNTFQGQLVKINKCSLCQNVKIDYETFTVLKIPRLYMIEDKKSLIPRTLKNCFQLFSTPEQVTWECIFCKKMQTGVQQTKVFTIPPKFLLCFEKPLHRITNRRIENLIKFPIRANFGEIISRETFVKVLVQNNYEQPDNSLVYQQLNYRLSAVINQSVFESESDDIFTFARNPPSGKFYTYRNEQAFVMDEKDLVSQTSYMLFYEIIR